MAEKTCCFIGHRKINVNKDFIEKLKLFIENLIVEEEYSVFLFGSRSEFDDLRYDIITELKKKFINVKRYNYACKGECFILEKERTKMEKIFSSVLNEGVRLKGFEKNVDYESKFLSGKSSYIQRNYKMIADCDFCIIYYDKNYLLDKRRSSKHCVTKYQPKSGTYLAYKYIKAKKKNYINTFTLFS